MSHDTIPVGALVVIIHAAEVPDALGRIAEVVGERCDRYCHEMRVLVRDCYEVELSDGPLWIAHRNVRPLPPERDIRAFDLVQHDEPVGVC